MAAAALGAAAVVVVAAAAMVVVAAAAAATPTPPHPTPRSVNLIAVYLSWRKVAIAAQTGPGSPICPRKIEPSDWGERVCAG